MTAKRIPQPDNTQSDNGSDTFLNQDLPHTTINNGKSEPITEKQLGNLMATYAHTKIDPGDRFLMIAIGILFVLVLGYAIYLNYYGSAAFGHSVGIAWSRPGFLLAGGLLIVWLFIFGLSWNGKKSSTVYHRGLVLWKPFNKEKVILWREISGVTYAQDEWHVLAKTIVRYHATLFPNRARQIRLSVYCPKKYLPELLTLIKANLYPYLEPELRNEIRKGKRAFFGMISISIDGLYMGKDFYPWTQIKKLDIENGALLIQIQDAPIRPIAIRRIPNLELLLPLIRLASEANQGKEHLKS